MYTVPDLTFERQLWKSGLRYIAGLDEAGRGALAGPVAVGAVILPKIGPERSAAKSKGRHDAHPERNRGVTIPITRLAGVRDSKQMTPPQRDSAALHIKESALAWSVGFASAEEIDAGGIVWATRLAALRALEGLGIFPEYLLTDFRLELPQLDIGQTALVKGDALCLSIAAASVLAKTARDALMRDLDLQIPGYGLGRHKGYGTQAHRLALKHMGRSAIHRRTFSVKL